MTGFVTSWIAIPSRFTPLSESLASPTQARDLRIAELNNGSHCIILHFLDGIYLGWPLVAKPCSLF